MLYGEKYHAEVFYYQLKNYKYNIFEPLYLDKINSEIDLKKFDLFHLISPPLLAIFKLKKYNKPILFHWIGTDVYRLIIDSLIKRTLKKFLIQSANVKSLVVSENLQQELSRFNIDSTILPLTNLKFNNKISPIPENFSVLAYVPGNRWDFYHGDLILKLAQMMPDTEFHILAAGNRHIEQPNVFLYDFMDDISSFYGKCSALLRITVHDGLPKMILEMLSYGRHVLWSQAFPHCFKVNNIDECFTVLNKIKNDRTINQEGKNYVERIYNTENILEQYLSLCQELTGIK